MLSPNHYIHLFQLGRHLPASKPDKFWRFSEPTIISKDQCILIILSWINTNVLIHFISFHFRSTYINTYVYLFYCFLRILNLFTNILLNPRIARVYLQTYPHTKFWRSSLRGSVKGKKYFLFELSNTTHCFHFEFAYWVIYCITIRYTTLHHLTLKKIWMQPAFTLATIESS